MLPPPTHLSFMAPTFSSYTTPSSADNLGMEIDRMGNWVSVSLEGFVLPFYK